MLPFRTVRGAYRSGRRESSRGRGSPPVPFALRYQHREERGRGSSGLGIRIPGSSRHPIFQLGAPTGSLSIFQSI